MSCAALQQELAQGRCKLVSGGLCPERRGHGVLVCSNDVPGSKMAAHYSLLPTACARCSNVRCPDAEKPRGSADSPRVPRSHQSGSPRAVAAGRRVTCSGF